MGGGRGVGAAQILTIMFRSVNHFIERFKWKEAGSRKGKCAHAACVTLRPAGLTIQVTPFASIFHRCVFLQFRSRLLSSVSFLNLLKFKYIYHFLFQTYPVFTFQAQIEALQQPPIFFVKCVPIGLLGFITAFLPAKVVRWMLCISKVFSIA